MPGSCRTGQLMSADGEWWGISLSEAPLSWGLHDDRFLSIDIPEEIVIPYTREWEDGSRDFLVPAAVLTQYPPFLLRSLQRKSP